MNKDIFIIRVQNKKKLNENNLENKSAVGKLANGTFIFQTALSSCMHFTQTRFMQEYFGFI